ncbi:hypothetical protein TWF730_005469 [Orbilia blumenaviensis]|uniref:SANT domain-containing protein n=1 Tax=Orbilia blumenaviensis TaxID=1796055 RepID=A0AAV9VKR5_9PEZI
MSSQQSPPPHQGPPSNRNQPSTASRSISPHKRTRSPEFSNFSREPPNFSREPPKGPRAYLTHQGGPPAGGPGNSSYGGRVPPGSRGRSPPPPIGPRSRATVGPLGAGSGMSPVNDNYGGGFRDRRDYDDYRNRPPIPQRVRDVPPGNGIERRQSIGGPMGGPYSRRTSPPRRSRSPPPPERRGWNDRPERYQREDFRDGREDYFARGARDDRHFQREGHPRDARERDYSYSSSYRPEPREPYNNPREFHHRQSISSQGLPIVSPVDDPNKLAREQREREAAEYKKRRTVGPRPNDPPERKRSTHTRSPSPSGQHQTTHSPPHTVSSRYTSNPSPSTNSPPPLSDRNNERTLSDTPFKSDNQPPQSVTPQTPHPPHTPSTFQRNLTRPTPSVPILSAPAPPSVPSFRDIPLGPRALSNSSLRTIPTGPRIPPTGPRWDKDKKDGDKDDSGALIKEEPHEKTIDDKPPIDEPSPVEEGEVVNSGDERSFEGNSRDIEMENINEFRKESSSTESRFDRGSGVPAHGVTDIVETKKDALKDTLVKEAPLIKEPTEPKPVPQEKRSSTGAENIMHDQLPLSASPTTRNPPALPSPSTESAKPAPIQPAHFAPTSPSQPSQTLPPSVPTGPRALNNPSGRGGGASFWGRRGNMMTSGPFGRGVGPAPYPVKREEEERRPSSWNPGRGGIAGGSSNRNFASTAPTGHFNRPGQPFTSPKLTSTELRAGRTPSADVIVDHNLEKGQESNGAQVVEGPLRPSEPQDVEMEDAPQTEPPTTIPEPNVKQESPVETKSSPNNVKTETPTDDDDALTSSDVTKRIEEIDQRIGLIESQLNALDTRKQSKQVQLQQMDLQEAETAAKAVREQEDEIEEVGEPKQAIEDGTSSQGATKQDSLSPSLAAEFAAQTMDDKPRLPGPMDSSPEPEQPSTPKMLHDLAPIVKEDEDAMVTDVKEEPGALAKETFDTSSLPYFIAGRQREPVEYEFWNANISQHSKVENILARHILERKMNVEQKMMKLRQEYRDHLPGWKQDCEKLDSEEKRNKKSDSEPADAAPAEAVPATANLEVSGTASLGRRSGRGVSSDFVSSEYEIERIMKLSEKEEAEKAEAEAKEKYDDSREAVVPDMILDPEEKARLLYVDTNNIITDKSSVKGIFLFERAPDNWTEEEQKVFKERFAQFPKQWGKIALGIEGRDYKACILHYYQTKQDTPYKDLVRPAKTTRRRKPGRTIAITNARTTRARASAATLTEARRGTPLEDEDVDSEDVPTGTVGRPRRAAAPVFGDNDDNATPGPTGKRQAGGKPSINVEDVSTPTPADKPTGKRRGGPKAEKEKKDKGASRGRTPNAIPASEKTEKTIKNKGDLLQTPPELGVLANLTATESSVLSGLPPGRVFQEIIQPTPLLKQEPGTKLEDDLTRLQQSFAAPYTNPHQMPMSTPGIPQPEIISSRPLAPGRRPGAPGGRGRKAAQVDEDGVVIAPVTSSYWSVPETQDFPQLLASFGTNFEAIAEHLGTKTTTMVRNNYQRGCEQGKDYQRIAEEANRKIASGEVVPQPPPPILPSSKRRYDNSNSQASRAAQAQVVDPDTEMIDPGARKQPRALPPQGAIFAPNRTVAVGPEARIPAQIQSKPGPKPGTFKETRPSTRPPPFVQSATGIEDYRTVIPPRGPIEPSGKTPAQAIQIPDMDESPARTFSSSQASHQNTIELNYERQQRQQGMPDPRVVLQQQQEHLARQEQAARTNKMAQQQPSRPPQTVQLHAQTHPTQITIQEQPGAPRFDPRDLRNDPRDPRPQDQYRAQPPHLQELVKQEPRGEKRLSGEKLVPMPGIDRHTLPLTFQEDKRPRSPPIQRRHSPQVSTPAAPRTVPDPVVSKMVLGPTYKDDRSPPRMPIEQVQSQPHIMHVQQQPQVSAHRRHDSGNHSTPPAMPPQAMPSQALPSQGMSSQGMSSQGMSSQAMPPQAMPPQSQQQHLRTASSSRPPYPPSQQTPANVPAPQQPPPPPAAAPAPPTAPSKSTGFSLASILNGPDEQSRPPARPSNETWFGTSTSSSPYTTRDPAPPQRPQPEPVSHYNSPSLSAAVPHAFGRHSPTPSEPLYHTQRPPSSVPLPQGPVSGTMFQKTYPPAQTRTPPPRSTSHPNYPPQQPPPHSQVSSGPPVSSYHEHPSRHHPPPQRDPNVDMRERDPRDHYGQYPPSRQHQFSPPNYQNAYPPPSSQAPPPLHREPIERIHPDRTMHQHPHHIQTQQPGGYPPPPQQYHPSRPGEQQGPPPSLMPPSGFYDYSSRPRQMDSHERGNR